MSPCCVHTVIRLGRVYPIHLFSCFKVIVPQGHFLDWGFPLVWVPWGYPLVVMRCSLVSDLPVLVSGQQ